MTRRRRVWYLRIRVPSDLKSLLGTFLVRSLKTTDKPEAQHLAIRQVAVLPAFWREMRGKMAELLGKRLEDLQMSDFVGCDRAQALADLKRLKPVDVNFLFVRLQYLVDENQDDHQQALEGHASVRQMTHTARVARLEGIIEGMKSASSAVSLGATTTTAPPPVPEPQPFGSAEPWVSYKDDFFADHVGVSESTLASYHQTLRELEEVVGNKAINAVTTADIARFADHLRDRVSGRGGKLSRKSIVKLLNEAKRFFAWAEGKGLIAVDPSTKVKARQMNASERLVEGDSREGRRAFTTEELTKIFGSPWFTGCKSSSRRTTPGTLFVRDARYYYVLSAFLTGARAEELPHAKIVEYGGIQWLDFSKTGTKTPASRRWVPIVPALRRTGFVSWANQRSEAGMALFSGADASKDWSKLCNNFFDTIGISDPDAVLHSFRHNMRQTLSGCGIQDITISRFLGHKNSDKSSGVTGVYGRGLSVEEAELIVKHFKPPIALDYLYIE